MTGEPQDESEQDSFHAGCMATCAAGIACIAGAIFSAWMVYLTAFIAGIMGTGLGVPNKALVWHILMGLILLRCVTIIARHATFLNARIYRMAAVIGLTLGYVPTWLLFTFG